MLQRKLDKYHPLNYLGYSIIVFPHLFCSLELGWGEFNTGLGPGALYLIAIISGAVGGAFCGQTYPVPGALGGIVGSVGALFAAAMVLSQVDSIRNGTITLVALAGSLPGFGLFFVLAVIQDMLYPPPNRIVSSSTQHKPKSGPDLSFLNEAPSQPYSPPVQQPSLVACPYCGMQLANDPQLSRQAVQCPNCQGAFQMP